MENIDLSGKLICLILACQRPYYQSRLAKNNSTIQLILDKGYIPIILYGDTSLTAPKLLADISGVYRLYVPTDESYFRLSTRMELAYQWLKNVNCKGILKLDDNTSIKNPECLSLLDTISSEYDYFGISLSTLLKGEYQLLDPRFGLAHMSGLTWKLEDNLTFFIGPFYWISNKALSILCSSHLTLPLEDASVGLALSKHPELTRLFLPWFEHQFITWSSDTELL